MGKFLNYVLGGSTSPMAGDGYAYSTSSLKSPTISPFVKPSGYFCNNRNRRSSSKNSPEPAPIPSPGATGNTEQVNTLESQSLRRWPDSPRSPDTATAADVTIPAQLARPSEESIRTASANSVINEPLVVPKDVSWQEFEIPQELELVKDGTPTEIRNIIQESMDEQRALRASLLQHEVALVATDLGLMREDNGPVVAESSAMASARSTPNSDNSRSTLDLHTASDTSLEADIEDDDHLKPPPLVAGRSSAGNSLQSSKHVTTPTSELTKMQRRFLDSKIRKQRSHKLVRLLRSEKFKREAFQDPMSLEPTITECTSCFDEISEIKAVRLPCRHYYCSSCFARLVSTSIEYEINYPPKCCHTDIPRKTIRENLAPETYANYDKKALEYAIPIGNRYYCVSPTCGKWIDTRYAKCTNGAVECQDCAVKLCSVCCGPQHPSTNKCPQDFSLEMTLEQAERAGWRRCYNCKALVELARGCRHITCTCAAQFCYTCGAKWRTCRCTQDDQDRRAREIQRRLAALAQSEADQQAREVEMRAANAAAEAAERQLREEREAEDARLEEEGTELARIESERVRTITDYFQYLREILERVRLRQQLAIEKRHDEGWGEIDSMRNEFGSLERTARREAYVKSERDKISNGTEHTIKALQRQHAASMMEMINCHRKDQDELMADSAENINQDADILKAEALQELMPIQDLKRAALKSQQAREIQKWRDSGEASLQAFDARMIASKMRLEEAEQISEREQEVRNTIFADGKWTELLFEERFAMLVEDERNLVRNGGEAPAVPKDGITPQRPTQLQDAVSPTRKHRPWVILP